MEIWRLQVVTGGSNISQYCLDNHVAAMGWSLQAHTKEERGTIKNFQQYCVMAKKEYGKIDNVYRLVEEVKENDIIWMRSNGRYYFARVTENSKWQFCNTDEAFRLDACNQLNNIYWYPASDFADEESVPGAIATAFIRGATIQRIHKSGVKEYSQMLFNLRHDKNIDSYMYDRPELYLDEKMLYSMLSPDDAEDLVCLWLYKKYGYIVIPSSNKNSTPKYECVLLDPNSKERKHIYIQVKKGEVNLDATEYKDLAGEVYLLTTEGMVKNKDKYDNIFVISPKEIFDFATEPANTTLIPESIDFWIKFLSNAENEDVENDNIKGIMFDTNLSFSDVNEKEMLEQNRICAYGAAQRYIYSFRKGDYVLYYSKGKGIIAVGKIISLEAKRFEKEDGLYQEVEMIVAPTYDKGVVSKWLTAREIKEHLNRGFYFASTIKTPYLSEKQAVVLINALKEK